MSQPYFVDHKRGEINELRVLLSNPKIKNKRDVIKKVIAYMTLGIDASKLYSEMIMAANTHDLVQKKMVYHYLCSYAQQKPDIALLCINTLQKDCRDQDPMVRGLALRSLCTLRVPNIAEYAMVPMRKCLSDNNPYVRKTAVLGAAKLFALSPAAIRDSDLVDVLYNTLRDKDAQVVMNAISALDEILVAEGGMAVNQKLMLYLFNRLHEFPEWGQCVLLQAATRYKPTSEEEMFGIMNLLEDRLKHANSAVVMAATKVFLHVTEDAPEIQQEVYRRLKAPMLTLMAAGSVELSYVVLSHFKVLIARAPAMYADVYKHFFCRYNDPTCVKLLKIDALTHIASEQNATELLTEIPEYISDTATEVARAAVQAMGKIAIAVPRSADEALEHLLSFLDLGNDAIATETVVVCRDVLRKYPERYEDVMPALHKVLKDITSVAGKTAVVWMIGEFGDTLLDAPYILEGLVANWDEESSPEVRLELVTAAAKLFFKRPPELQSVLGKVLKLAVDDTHHVDVRDRGLLYYRLLKQDVMEAAHVLNSPKVVLESFSEQEDKDSREAIFRQFNSLSVVYNLPESRFCKLTLPTDDGGAEGGAKDMGDKDQPLSMQGDADEVDPEVAAAAQAAAAGAAAASSPTSASSGSAPAVSKQDSLDFLGMFGGGDASPATGGGWGRAPALALEEAPAIDPATFQNLWMAQEGSIVDAQLRRDANGASLDGLLASHRIYTLASGASDGVVRYFLYASPAGAAGSFFLAECRVTQGSGAVSTTIKSKLADDLTKQFTELFISAITGSA